MKKNILLLFAAILPATMFAHEKQEQSAEENSPADTLCIDTPEESIFDNYQTWIQNFTYTIDCDSLDSVPQYSDEDYKRRLSLLANVIELPYNKIVRMYIDFYINKRREQVETMLGLSNYYFPIFEQALEENDMPLELRYLPVIESALNPSATSPVGAAGLWQFMIATGRIYGLKVNSLVDERRDPIKSTNAGVKYLKDLYKLYNDWHLAIAAYNCGPGNVNKAIHRAGGKRDYWTIYYYLPKETRGYVPAFIAANYVMNYYHEHNICPAEIEIPTTTDTVIVNTRFSLVQASEVLNVPIEKLRLCNPQYRRDIVPGDIMPCPVFLPTELVDDFMSNQDTIARHRADELNKQLRAEVVPVSSGSYYSGSGNKIYYRVKQGDVLGKIATRYHVSVSNLKRWNGLRSDNIRIGQRLIIYTKNASGGSYSGNSSVYKVRPGDTLTSIASKYPNVSVSDIKRANNKTSDRLSVGETLRIPQK